MTKFDIIRAWKDESFKNHLSQSELASLPESPVGSIDLSDSDLEGVVGAASEHILTLGCCPGLTSDPGACSLACGPGTITPQQCFTGCLDTGTCGSRWCDTA